VLRTAVGAPLPRPGAEIAALGWQASIETQILIVSGTEEETGWKAAAAAGADAFPKKDGDLEEWKHVVLETASITAALGTHTT
jgi:hypothetical protein